MKCNLCGTKIEGKPKHEQDGLFWCCDVCAYDDPLYW